MSSPRPATEVATMTLRNFFLKSMTDWSRSVWSGRIPSRRVLRLVFGEGDGQGAIDAISGLMDGVEDWRLVVLPVEASLPKPAAKLVEASARRKFIALREELYQDVAGGAKLHRDFLLLTLLSTIVAVFGLSADNVAVVIGAMVIAPLLGPILAFSFASALGDLELMARSARTALVGLAFGMALSALIGLVFGADLTSQELSGRTVVGLDSTVLALACLEGETRKGRALRHRTSHHRS